jgi:hypothetical protein
MTLFYAFNGDADGLCALQQLRLVDPRGATLVTGVKRDIQLLRRVNAATGDEVTVLDISLDANRERLCTDCWKLALPFATSTTTTRASCRNTGTSRHTSRNRPTSVRALWSTAISPGVITRGPSWRPSATTSRTLPLR